MNNTLIQNYRRDCAWYTILSACALLFVSASLSAEAPEAIRSLAEFGPYNSVAEANQTLGKAVDALEQQGGGGLTIPPDAPEGFTPKNVFQTKIGAPAVTIYDYRQGAERIYVPPLGGFDSSQSGGQGSRIIEREMTEPLGAWGTRTTQRISSTYLRGASSYSQASLDAVTAGQDQRCYVPTHRGLFLGQNVNVSATKGSYSGKGGETVTIKKLGFGEQYRPYFVADFKYDHPEGALVNNKNHVNGLSVLDKSHTDNQGTSLNVYRWNYASGDSFNIKSTIHYQGSGRSSNGDEGGATYDGTIVHDPFGFQGEVESWAPDTHELVFTPGSRYPDKLGMSRPLINLNEKKWVSSGNLRIIGPGVPHPGKHARHESLIIGSADSGWGKEVVGRWFAVNDPTEYLTSEDWRLRPHKEKITQPIRRWWHITDMEEAPDGRYYLYVETGRWGVNRHGGPILYRQDNYTNPKRGEIKPLNYVIAPGAWVTDVSQGVGGKTRGSIHLAHPDEPRTLGLAPSSSEGTDADFEPGDPITQAPNAMVYDINGVRIRHFNHFPVGHDKSILIGNHGSVSVETGLLMNDERQKNRQNLEQWLKTRKDGEPSFITGVSIGAVTRDALLINGPVQNAAIRLDESDGNIKPIVWDLGQTAPHQVRIYANPENGRLVVEGDDVDLTGHGVVRQSGISATSTQARNLRGIDVAVTAGQERIEVKFSQPEPDADYAVWVQPSWFAMDKIEESTKDGFVVRFSEGAPRDATIDWLIVR